MARLVLGDSWEVESQKLSDWDHIIPKFNLESLTEIQYLLPAPVMEP